MSAKQQTMKYNSNKFEEENQFLFMPHARLRRARLVAGEKLLSIASGRRSNPLGPVNLYIVHSFNRFSGKLSSTPVDVVDSQE